VFRMVLAGGNMVAAFLLAILTIVYLGFNYPPVISASLRWARVVKDIITGTGLNPSYNVWLEFFLDEKLLVFIAYTIMSRMALAAFTFVGYRLWDGVRQRLRSSG